MTKGTIVLTPFPFTDLSTIKRRPAVIVSSFEKDWREIFPSDFYQKELDTINNCLQRIIIIAKNDLEVK